MQRTRAQKSRVPDLNHTQLQRVRLLQMEKYCCVMFQTLETHWSWIKCQTEQVAALNRIITIISLIITIIIMVIITVMLH